VRTCSRRKKKKGEGKKEGGEKREKEGGEKQAPALRDTTPILAHTLICPCWLIGRKGKKEKKGKKKEGEVRRPESDAPTAGGNGQHVSTVMPGEEKRGRKEKNKKGRGEKRERESRDSLNWPPNLLLFNQIQGEKKEKKREGEGTAQPRCGSIVGD